MTHKNESNAGGLTIEPTVITDYNRTDEELERFWLFCIIVAGKNADWAAEVVSRLLRNKPADQLPLAYLESLGNGLHNVLVANRVGQYCRIESAIKESFNLDLRTAGVDELMQVYGVGNKTARFFLLHSRPGVKVAVLDTHVLSWLRLHGVITPTATPTSKRQYQQLETVALKYMDTFFRGLSPAQADLLIWSTQSGRLEVEYPPHSD